MERNASNASNHDAIVREAACGVALAAVILSTIVLAADVLGPDCRHAMTLVQKCLRLPAA